MSDDRYREWDAAYVLGSLSPDERHEYEAHLTTCPECRAAVAELAGVPGMLGRLDAETAASIRDLPDDGRVADRARLADDVPRLAKQVRRRRRRALALGGLAVAAALVIGLAFGVAIPRLTAPAATTVALSPVGGSGVTAQLEATSVGWGTELTWSCSYGTGGTAYAGEVYSLVVTTKDGRMQTVATWGAKGDHAGNLTASTSIPVSDISAIDIRVADRTAPLSRARL